MLNFRIIYVIASLIFTVFFFMLYGIKAITIIPILIGIFLYSSLTIINLDEQKIKKQYAVAIVIFTSIISFYYLVKHGGEMLFIFWLATLSILSMYFLHRIFIRSRSPER